MNRKLAFDLLCLGIREGGTYEYLEAMRGALTGSHPSDHAQLRGHGASRFDPARKQ